MERVSTMFLRGAVILVGLLALALCVFVFPGAISDENTGGYRLILLGLYVPAIPFFVALYQALLLLHYIDTNTAFSELSVKALKYIKYCAITISALFLAGMPYMYAVAKDHDPPGGILFGLIIFASGVIAGFAAVLQKLLKNAIDIKSENDLTV